MKWIEAKVVFDHPDKDLASDLISDVFYDLDLQGVVVEDPDLEPDEGWGEDTIGRPTQHAIIGYYPKDRRAEDRCEAVENRLTSLKEKFDFFYRISYKELDEEDWAEFWKEFFEPQKIGQRIVVKPTWREHDVDPGDIVLTLDPGMAFGTGTHPTTSLCVNLIETYLNKGDSVLDIGTGTGILMIAAAKLGASIVCGVDKDELAVEIASNNLRINGVAPQRYSVKQGILIEGINEKYNLVVANILTQVISNLLEGIEKVLCDQSVFICSGILEKNEKLILARMENIGFEIIEVVSQEEWVAITSKLKRQNPLS